MSLYYKASNKKMAYTVTTIVVLVSFTTILIPMFFVYTFPISRISTLVFLFPGYLLWIFGIIFFTYFLVTGVYYFEFRADQYVIEVCSRRTISFFYSKIDFIEMPTSSIIKYTFYNRPFTFNTTLMIKVRLSRRRTVAKRFTFAFLNKAKREAIANSLEKIVQKNHLDE